MTVPEGKPPESAALWHALRMEDEKNQRWINLADGKTAILCALLATIISLVGVVLALLIGRARMMVTLPAEITGTIAVLCFLGEMQALTFAMWPRLRGLRRDGDVGVFRARLYIVATEAPPTDIDYLQPYGAQVIMFRKNWGVRLMLIGLNVMVISAGATVGLLLFPLK